MLNDEASTSGEKEATDVPIDTNQLDVIMPNEQPSKVDLASVAVSIKQTNADHDDGDNDAAVTSTGSRESRGDGYVYKMMVTIPSPLLH